MPTDSVHPIYFTFLTSIYTFNIFPLFPIFTVDSYALDFSTQINNFIFR